MKEYVKTFEGFAGGPDHYTLAGQTLLAMSKYLEQWREDGARKRPLYWLMRASAADFVEMDTSDMRFFGDEDMNWLVPEPESSDRTIGEFLAGLDELDFDRIYNAAANQVNELERMSSELPDEVRSGMGGPDHYRVFAELILMFHENAMNYVMDKLSKKDSPQAQPVRPQPSIDDILDKININGVQSLTDAQRGRLDAASGKKRI